jgi:hypothetical protein
MNLFFLPRATCEISKLAALLRSVNSLEPLSTSSKIYYPCYVF